MDFDTENAVVKYVVSSAVPLHGAPATVTLSGAAVRGTAVRFQVPVAPEQA